MEELTELVSKIPKLKKPNDPYGETELQVLYWVGQLREFAALAAEDNRRSFADSLASLDAAVGRHGGDAQRFYEEGRAKSRAVRDDFEKRIGSAESDAVAAKLNIERRAVTQYVNLPNDQCVQQILAGLDD
jgi:hypothetical protein